MTSRLRPLDQAKLTVKMQVCRQTCSPRRTLLLGVWQGQWLWLRGITRMPSPSHLPWEETLEGYNPLLLAIIGSLVTWLATACGSGLILLKSSVSGSHSHPTHCSRPHSQRKPANVICSFLATYTFYRLHFADWQAMLWNNPLDLVLVSCSLPPSFLSSSLPLKAAESSNISSFGFQSWLAFFLVDFSFVWWRFSSQPSRLPEFSPTSLEVYLSLSFILLISGAPHDRDGNDSGILRQLLEPRSCFSLSG